MNQSVERLRRILELERAQGYADLAVIGGLDRFLGRWADKAGSSLAQFPHLCPGYAALAKRERKEWLETTLARLRDREETVIKAQDEGASASRQGISRAGPTTLDTPITAIRGVSSGLAAKFGKLGVKTIRELLYLFPRRHLDYSQRKPISELEVGLEQTIVATVWGASEKTFGRGRRGTEAIVGDETGNIRIVWFHQPYLAKKLGSNSRLVISGKISLFQGRKVFESPEYEFLESDDLIHTGRLIPIYPLTAGLSPRTARRMIKTAVDRWSCELPDFLPQEVRRRTELLGLAEAIKQTHYPDNSHHQEEARKRLAFDELFLIQLGVLAKRRDWQQGERGNALAVDSGLLQHFLSSLPFPLTSAQERALGEICRDLSQPKPMSRLLQGEVGSGKTVVATAAMLIAVASGYQAALMAPTEVLAQQHFDTICHLLSRASGQNGREGNFRSYPSLLSHPLTVGLLIGGGRERERREVQQSISEAEIDIIIGTHALIQKGVGFGRLGLAVVDEQHRFGVMQRLALRQKGISPHLLVMSATPIPRTLALTIYGDLDLSVIDQLPPGRPEIKTRWLSPDERPSAYNFIRQQIERGRQAFIICPLIEESESILAKAATTEYERLSQKVFPHLRLGLLHGRMSPPEKEEVMGQFRRGELAILVSTPVVEVGIDIPNATVMLVEGADRFGLAQLHQFRGRVGRGHEPSYCLLLSESPSSEARERLSILERVRDGFVLAEEDLRLRGPGEFFGTRQSGLPDLRLARLSDMPLLELAREEAMCLFEADPWLRDPEHKLLADEVARLWQNGGEQS